MMWGVLANYGDIATFSVVMLVCFKLIRCRNVIYIQFAGILVHLSY